MRSTVNRTSKVCRTRARSRPLIRGTASTASSGVSTINPDNFSKAKVILQKGFDSNPFLAFIAVLWRELSKGRYVPPGTIAASSNRGGNQDKKDKPQQSSQAAGKDPNRGKDNPNSN